MLTFLTCRGEEGRAASNQKSDNLNNYSIEQDIDRNLLAMTKEVSEGHSLANAFLKEHKKVYTFTVQSIKNNHKN